MRPQHHTLAIQTNRGVGLKITGAFLAEKVEVRPNGMYVEGGVFPALRQDPDSGDQLVWLALFVQRDGQDQRTGAEDFAFTVEVEPLNVTGRPLSSNSVSLEAAPEAFLAGNGFSAHLLQLSPEDLPVNGLYTLIVIGPHGEKFTLPFEVETAPSDIV